MKRKSSPSSEAEASQCDGGSSAAVATTAVTLNLAAFSCPSCREPLTSSIYQCDQGHIACSVCASGMKCRSCAQPTGNIRCLGLEKVIESMRTPCKYAELGCLDKPLFRAKLAHEEKCLYEPYFCPHSSCIFKGSALDVSSHFDVQHPGAAICFQYSVPFELSLRKQKWYQCLKGEDGLLFVLKRNNYDYKYIVELTCIQPADVKWKFCYDITARGEAGTAVLHIETATVKNIKSAKCFYFDDDFDNDYEFLVIPKKLLQGEKQCVDLTICIRKATK